MTSAVPMEDQRTPGVTRFDVVCQPEAEHTVLELVRGWAEDRALREPARMRLTALVRAALGHGLAYHPRAVTVLVRWCAPEQVRVDLRWWGSAATVRSHQSDDEVEAMVSVLDALAVHWDVAVTDVGWVHWLVASTDVDPGPARQPSTHPRLPERWNRSGTRPE
jgi:hypothetical protein